MWLVTLCKGRLTDALDRPRRKRKIALPFIRATTRKISASNALPMLMWNVACALSRGILGSSHVELSLAFFSKPDIMNYIRITSFFDSLILQ
jgi:hypothetical protein